MTSSARPNASARSWIRDWRSLTTTKTRATRSRSNPKGLKTGYNPYNSGALGKQSWKKNKDLRELSKWIELKKKTAAKDKT